MTDKTYVGIAPLTVVRRVGGFSQDVYAGAPVPGDITPDDLDRLLGEGYIIESDTAGGMQNDVPGQSLLEQTQSPVDPDGRPSKRATKDAWVAYAVAQGADPAEADAKNKDDLIAEYGA